jgi:HAD superfamily hydrolase (TIGR01509 family)
MPLPPALVLYDFNGVIADDEPAHQRLSQEVLGEEGVPVTDAEYHEVYLGYDDRGCFVEAFRRAGKPLSEAHLDALIQKKAERYAAFIARHLVLFPGAVESVLAMAAIHPLAVVSGALRAEIAHVLKVAGVADRFRFVVASEDTERCKPDPEGYEIALARWNALAPAGQALSPGRCVVIEDSIAGVQAAKAAGMRCVAVTHSYRPDELAHADRIIDRMADFTPALVAELAGGAA